MPVSNAQGTNQWHTKTKSCSGHFQGQSAEKDRQPVVDKQFQFETGYCG